MSEQPESTERVENFQREQIKLVDFNSYPLADVLPDLLKDRTLGKNIVFATDGYEDLITGGTARSEITAEILRANSGLIQPRVCKSQEQQAARTREKAEVFTPSWLCNHMNNHCDKEWFGRDGVFNVETDQGWTTNEEAVVFDPPKDWKEYVKSTRLEITCGEAPYLVSRYDAATGVLIPVGDRIGILDRKLRVVNENTKRQDDWLRWTLKAFQSVYGYEFQGDSLLLARANLLLTFTEYLKVRWARDATIDELNKIADVISWNLWQMDGLKCCPPFYEPAKENEQFCLFDISESKEESADSMIYDWEAKATVPYKNLKKRER